MYVFNLAPGRGLSTVLSEGDLARARKAVEEPVAGFDVRLRQLELPSDQDGVET